MKLRDALKQGKFVVTSEIQSPVDETPEELVGSMQAIRNRLDGVAVSEVELEGIVSDTIQTCDLLQQNRFEAIYQTATRQKNRLQLQQDLLNAHEAGIENLLVFTEDYRLTGDSLQEMMFFHVDAGKLGSVLDHLKTGSTVDGRALPANTEFTVGTGVESAWGKNIPEMEMKEMEEMARLGTGYFLTTPVFDLEKFEKFLKEAQTFGVPVIAEVLILRTVGMAQFLNRHIRSGLVPDWVIQKMAQNPDKLKASVELFADTVAGLKDLCQGVHIITIGGEDKLRRYLDAAKLK